MTEWERDREGNLSKNLPYTIEMVCGLIVALPTSDNFSNYIELGIGSSGQHSQITQVVNSSLEFKVEIQTLQDVKMKIVSLLMIT